MRELVGRVVLVSAVAYGVANARPTTTFEDLREKVPHTLHRPQVVPTGLASHLGLGGDVHDEALSVRLTFAMDENVTVDVDAHVSEHLVSPTYTEVYHHGNGTHERLRNGPPKRR